MSFVGDVESRIKHQIVMSEVIKGGIVTGLLLLVGVPIRTALIMGAGATAISLVADKAAFG